MSLRRPRTRLADAASGWRASPGRALRRAAALLAGLGALGLAACSAPDYTAVRDWAATASRGAEYPPIVTSCFQREDGSVTPSPQLGDATFAMQDALSTYLSAVGTLASDGVLTYDVDPFAELAGRVRAASEPGAVAVTALGGLLQRATRRNSQAPELGATLDEADDNVQALVAALRMAVREIGAGVAEERGAVAAAYQRFEQDTRDAAARRAFRDLGIMRDREYAAAAAARGSYDLLLARIAEGHALLKARSTRLSQEETARSVRAAEDALRRAAELLPRAVAPSPAGIACAPQQIPGTMVPAPATAPAGR